MIIFINRIVTPDQWEAYSTHNTAVTEEEIARSIRLREAIHQTIQQVHVQYMCTHASLKDHSHNLTSNSRNHFLLFSSRQLVI